jgi:hypothetical protein
MRFAWLREQSPDPVASKESLTNRLVCITYNLVWWIPIVLAFAKVIDYRAGSIAFFAITVVRAIANLYRNNTLTLEQAEAFPLRSP